MADKCESSQACQSTLANLKSDQYKTVGGNMEMGIYLFDAVLSICTNLLSV
ncbi:hypothetical protein [Parabacteroides goldsteinii]|uniref:hypothetical protein n=1 Tax=Parabacteroides goldsteinii TaxID=328812 RepID=UPI003AB21CD3